MLDHPDGKGAVKLIIPLLGTEELCLSRTDHLQAI
jgi:hypothetical protein